MNYTEEDYTLYPKTGGGRGFKIEKSVVHDQIVYRQTSGYVETPQGFCRAYSSLYLGQNGYKHVNSCLEMIKDGRVHYRRFTKEYTARGLVTKAKQFAKELYE